MSKVRPKNVMGGYPSSRLRDWDTKASVRSVPMRKLANEGSGLPFSPELVPILDHPEVAERGDALRYFLLGQKLHSYLRFTEHLERKAVIPACVNLSFNEVPFYVPRTLQRDASRIVVDEAHHAECAGDLTDQIDEVLNIGPISDREPGFLQRLRTASCRAEGCKRRLSELTFTSVSETLITGSLTQVPRDARVHPIVRNVLMDHARDEAKHHACFSDVIGLMWDQLDEDQRAHVGPQFAEFIHAFLDADRQVEIEWLIAGGIDLAKARSIVFDTHNSPNARSNLLSAARPTLTILERHGILDDARTVDALGMKGIIT